MHFDFLNWFWMSLKKKKKKKKNVPYVLSVGIFFFLHSYVSQNADKYSISLSMEHLTTRISMSRWKGQDFNCLYFQPVAYNFVGHDSSMHVNLSLSICLHLIKHMFKSSLEKGCLPEKRSKEMLFSASDTKLSQWVLQTAI